MWLFVWPWSLVDFTQYSIECTWPLSYFNIQYLRVLQHSLMLLAVLCDAAEFSWAATLMSKSWWVRLDTDVPKRWSDQQPGVLRLSKDCWPGSGYSLDVHANSRHNNPKPTAANAIKAKHQRPCSAAPNVSVPASLCIPTGISATWCACQT